MTFLRGFQNSLFKEVSAAPLVSFRILFGAVMFFSAIRFMAYGWVSRFYVEPKYFFPYYGFEWVKPLGLHGMYAVFVLLAVASLAILLGFYYRFFVALYFVLFTYVELIDKTNYLNHYYLISCISFWMIFLPMADFFSVDAWMRSKPRRQGVSAWTVWVLRFQLAVVYIFAGVAKINSDWLLDALPMRIWLPGYAYLPGIGYFFDQIWVAYFFSWAGCIYDLTVVFFLSYSKTHPWAYGVVILFHLTTWLLFPIGMFPWVMIFLTTIFFSHRRHTQLLNALGRRLNLNGFRLIPQSAFTQKIKVSEGRNSFRRVGISVFLLGMVTLQLLIPFRFLRYPGDLFWTEQGYRFSWRVMLMEKAGYATFYVADGNRGEVMIDNKDYLTLSQEKMMVTQPDMILQYAHILAQAYTKKGFKDLRVRAEVYVSLNGSASRLFIDPRVDLSKITEGFGHKKWVLSQPNI